MKLIIKFNHGGSVHNYNGKLNMGTQTGVPACRISVKNKVDEPNVDQRTPSINLKDVDIDTENWMGKLPEYLTNVPIIYLSIPGSHNSFTYSISPRSGVSPDSPQVVQQLQKFCKPLMNRIIYNWSQGQKEDVTQQLVQGIRYFDVRGVIKDEEILISHGLYGGAIQGFLEKMVVFLNSHKKEVVILDFQHFYKFHPDHHERLISMLVHIFGDKICQRQRRMRENTLRNLWNSKNQVLIIYRHQMTNFNKIIWPSSTWPTPWPNKIKVRELIDYLNKGLSNRKNGMGFVSQGILTPTAKYVALHVFGSLKKVALKTNQNVISWLESKNSGVNGINVVICDFVEGYDFCKKVILLNYKSLHDNQRLFVEESDAKSKSKS